MNNNWKESLRNSIRSSTELFHFLEVQHKFDDQAFPVFIPLNFAKKIKQAGFESPLWKQFVPDAKELDQDLQKLGLWDPIGDQVHAKGNGIIHRYQNRILFTPLTKCPINCRYCFRKNELATEDEIFEPNLLKALEYITKHPEINEVIFTGGDPLICTDEQLDSYLQQFSFLPQIKYIRFHTRTPIIIPERINDSFIQLIQKYQQHFLQINMVIHTNHLQEIDEEVEKALKLLTQNHINCLTQSVLLNGVNNSTSELTKLFEKLISLNIRPYYLHHPDHVYGGMHFYLSLEEGRKIYAKLRSHLPGWSLPHYVIDPSNGIGKTLAYNPESMQYSGQITDQDGSIHSMHF